VRDLRRALVDEAGSVAGVELFATTTVHPLAADACTHAPPW
jgi:hypothetical protein